MKERRIPESPLLEATFRVGQVVPASGVYQVQHSQHRLPAEITLPGAQHFPPCAACKYDVSFRFCRTVEIDGFSYTLNAIPPQPDLEDGGLSLPEPAIS